MKLTNLLYTTIGLFLASACSDNNADVPPPIPDTMPEVKTENVIIDPAIGNFSEEEGIQLSVLNGTFEMRFDKKVTAVAEGSEWLTITSGTGTSIIRFTVKDAPLNGKAGYIVLRFGNSEAVRITITPPSDSKPEPTPEPTPDPTPEPSPEPTPDPKPDPIPDPTPEPSPYPFDLSYELAMELSTVNNNFKGYNNWNGATYYPNLIEVFNAYPSIWEDTTAKTQSSNTYGFLTDAPKSYNHLSVPAFGNEVFVFRGYEGKNGSQYNSGGITIKHKSSLGFFRMLRFTLPIPADVLPTQKVVYQIKITNIVGNGQHDTPIITYEIVNR